MGDGLGELETEFNSGKMQYAFVRVLDPNTQLKKFILIIWQGEGVPATKKGMCANHVNDVKRFFKAHHMSICVRNEEDVTEDEIMKQETKTTANFTFVQPTAVGSCGPVGSVYKPIRPIDEIKKTKDDNFWQKIQSEEETRKKEESDKLASDQKEEEKRQKEEQQRSEANRRTIVKQRELDIVDKLKQQKLADDNRHLHTAEKEAWAQQEKEQEQAIEILRKNRRTSAVEHTQEAASMVQQRTNNPRNMWAQREKEAKNDVKKSWQQPPRRSLKSSTSSATVAAVSTAAVVGNDAKEVDDAFAPNTPAYQEPATPAYQEPAAPAYQEPEAPAYQEPAYQVPAYQEPVAPAYQEPATPAYQEPAYQEPAAAAYQEPTSQEANSHYEYAEEAAYNEAPAAQQDLGTCVRALYDYQAVDGSEISFDPEDMITNVEQIDEGWWRGIGPRGDYGLFPANYVELV